MSILEGQYLARRISIGTALLAPTSRSRSTGAPEGPGRARLRREFVHWRTDHAACGCLNTLRVITPRRARAIRRNPTCTLAAVYFCCLSFCFLFYDEPWPANGLVDPSVFDLILEFDTDKMLNYIDPKAKARIRRPYLRAIVVLREDESAPQGLGTRLAWMKLSAV